MAVAIRTIMVDGANVQDVVMVPECTHEPCHEPVMDADGNLLNGVVSRPLQANWKEIADDDLSARRFLFSSAACHHAALGWSDIHVQVDRETGERAEYQSQKRADDERY